MYFFCKRIFDIAVSLATLCLLSPLMLLIAMAIKLTSAGPVFFKQDRAGKNFRTFKIYKFRTMTYNSEDSGPLVSADNDSRITFPGFFLRKYKLDEIPQFINVLKGDMSIVGPRPEVLPYVSEYKEDYEEILKVRPGITCIASIKYRNESGLLMMQDDPENFYLSRVLPEKIRYYKIYLNKPGMLTDLKIIFGTVFSIFKK